METLYLVILSLVMIAGIAVIFFGIAGTFIITAGAFLYGLVTGFSELTLTFCLILLGITIAQEAVEELLTGVLARTFGGSRWAMAGAILGGIGGAVLGTPVAPVIGTLLGGFLGAFAGALLLEWLTGHDVKIALWAGIGALIGAVSGKITKIIVATVMAILVWTRVL